MFEYVFTEKENWFVKLNKRMVDSKLRKVRITKRHRQQYLILLFYERFKILCESYNSSSRYQDLDSVNQEGRHTGPKLAAKGYQVMLQAPRLDHKCFDDCLHQYCFIY